MKSDSQYVVLFDGVCNLCNGTVQFLIERDKGRKLRYASLQSDYGQEFLKHHDLPTEDFKSFLFVANGVVFKRSSAALKVLQVLGGLWSLTGIFFLVPPFIRNAVYDFVANNRYKWFGKKDECWVPKPELKELFVS